MDNKKKKILSIIPIILMLLITTMLSVYFKMIDDFNKATFKLNGEETITLEVGKEYKEPGYIAIVNQKDKEKDVKVISNLNVNAIGEYEISYTLDFNKIKKQKELKRKVKVIDTTPPVLTIEGKTKITKQVGDNFKVPNYKAIDNIDGNITKKVKVTSNVNTKKAGKYTVKYSVEDSSGNNTNKIINVTVAEKTKPKYTYPKNEKSNYKGTFIEVSIAMQTLKYYQNDRLVLKSNVVTGINNTTPTGTYKVINKARNTTLRGKDYASFVYYWIAFKGTAYGLHDATWRSSFGGKIYKTNGSHGCINMPYYNAQQLYSMVTIGTPVYIY